MKTTLVINGRELKMEVPIIEQRLWETNSLVRAFGVNLQSSEEVLTFFYNPQTVDGLASQVSGMVVVGGNKASVRPIYYFRVDPEKRSHTIFDRELNELKEIPLSHDKEQLRKTAVGFVYQTDDRVNLGRDLEVSPGMVSQLQALEIDQLPVLREVDHEDKFVRGLMIDPYDNEVRVRISQVPENSQYYFFEVRLRSEDEEMRPDQPTRMTFLAKKTHNEFELIRPTGLGFDIDQMSVEKFIEDLNQYDAVHHNRTGLAQSFLKEALSTIAKEITGKEDYSKLTIIKSRTEIVNDGVRWKVLKFFN